MTDKLFILGDTSFERMRTRGAYFVDKTAYIRQIYEDGNYVTLITRPRRFGKTLTQSMLKSFFELNYAAPDDRTQAQALFKGLAVEKDTAFCEANLGRWPVLSLSFKDVGGNTFEDALTSLATTLSACVQKYAFLTTSEKLTEFQRSEMTTLRNLPNLPFALQKEKSKAGLAAIIFAFYTVFNRSVIVLLDEYDVPLNKARTGGYYNDMIDVIREMLSRGLKDSDYLEKAVVTGCLRIAKESVFTGLNHFGCHTVSDDSLSDALGITTDEAQKVLADFGLTPYADAVRRHYDGYRFGNREMYCPWDLLCFCRDNAGKTVGEYTNYWTNTSGNDLIKEFVHYADESHLLLLRDLLAGKNVTGRITEDLSFAELNAAHSPENLLSLLYASGYLTSVGKNADGTRELTIPNEEVLSCFMREVADYFSPADPCYQAVGRDLLAALSAGNGANANRILQRFLLRYVSVRDTGSESFYHGMVLGLLGSALKDDLASNRESGDGYPDVSFLNPSDNTAVILEFKKTASSDPAALRASAQDALTQIHERRYALPFTDAGCQTIRLYGIAFSGKTCYTVLEIQKPA